MGSARIRWLVVAVIVAMLSAGCAPSRRYPRDQTKPTGSRGNPAITVDRGGRVTVGGVTVTIPPRGVDRDTILHVTVVPNLAAPAGTSIATPVVAVALERARLTKPAVIDLPVAAGIDPGTVIGGFFEPVSQSWKPLPSRADRATRVVHVSTPHFTRFFGIRIDPGPIVHGLTDKVKNLFTGRAGAGYPTCAGDHDHSDGITYTSDAGDLVKWCSGFSGGHRELTVVNNRSASVTVTYPSAWSRGNVTGRGLSFASLGRWLSTHAPPPRGYAYVVVGAGGAVVLEPPDGGVGGRVSVEMDIFTWALAGFDVAVSASLAVYEKFLKLPANKEQVLAGALTNGETASSIDFFGCMKTALRDVDPRRSVADAGFDQTMQAMRVAVTCGFRYVDDWIKHHVKSLIVGTVLAVVSATLVFLASGLTAVFAGLRNLYDTAKGATQYTINLNAGSTGPSVAHTGYGEYTLRFTHPAWGPVRLVTRMPSDQESGPGPVSITVVDASGRTRFSWHAGTFYRLRPAGTGGAVNGAIYAWGYPGVASPFDKLGHIFINFDPGRLNGVIVLSRTATGFANFGSLPPLNDYTGRFYGASVVDQDNDGIYEIEVISNDCEPSCAEGTETSTAYKWDGSNYTALVPPRVDTSVLLTDFLAAWKAHDNAAELRVASSAEVEKFNREFPADSYKPPRSVDLHRCPLNAKRAGSCEILLYPKSGGHASIVRILLHEDGFGRTVIDALIAGGDAG